MIFDILLKDGICVLPSGTIKKDIGLLNGKIKAIDIVKETGTEKSKGYGFVKMEHSRDALLAIESLNGSVVDGRTLKVSEASETKNNFKITKSYKKRSPIEEIEEEKAPQKKKNINHSKSGLHVLFDYLKN